MKRTLITLALLTTLGCGGKTSQILEWVGLGFDVAICYLADGNTQQSPDQLSPDELKKCLAEYERARFDLE